tara:strand:- start:5181 stop:5381 length:201 start_codon:yes stop_codon:yes gene_type:complete
MAKKENPCKGKKKGTKELVTCQYNNKVISQKKYIRLMRKITGKTTSLADMSGMNYTLSGQASRGKE